MEIRPPFQNRLICSNCGCKTSYATDGEYEAGCSAVMNEGGVFIAFCDFCESLAGLSEGSFALFQGETKVIDYPYATGLKG